MEGLLATVARVLSHRTFSRNVTGPARAAVPRQTELHDLPREVAEAMNGYWDDQYVLVRDTMVIVDRNSRRVAAIVPGVA
jgi:hypothetical protein